MTGDRRPHLRVVGGNDALARCGRLNRETRWPPLRVVGPSDEESASSQLSQPPLSLMPATMPVGRPATRRAAWSQALLAGLIVVMLSSVGQAIAHW